MMVNDGGGGGGDASQTQITGKAGGGLESNVKARHTGGMATGTGADSALEEFSVEVQRGATHAHGEGNAAASEAGTEAGGPRGALQTAI